MKIKLSEKIGAEPRFISGSGKDRHEITRSEAACIMHNACKNKKRKKERGGEGK